MSPPAPKVSIATTTTTAGTLCHAAQTHIYFMRMCKWVRVLHMRMPLPPDSAPLSVHHLLSLLLAVSYVLHAHVYVFVCVIRTFRAAFWHLKFSRSYSGAGAFSSPSRPCAKFPLRD